MHLMEPSMHMPTSVIIPHGKGVYAIPEVRGRSSPVPFECTVFIESTVPVSEVSAGSMFVFPT